MAERTGRTRAQAHRHQEPARALQRGLWLLYRSAAQRGQADTERLRAPRDHLARRALCHAGTQGEGSARFFQPKTASTNLEYELFAGVRRETAMHSARLQAAARILAQIDALSALADAAVHYNYVRPLVDDGETLEIREGRHPVVERFLRDDERFVPNDARLDGDDRSASSS